MLGIILENSGVRRYNLKLVRVFIVLLAQRTQVVRLWNLSLFKRIWNANYHRARVLDHVHCFGILDWDHQERIGSFEYLHCLFKSIENPQSFVHKYSDLDCNYFCVGLTLGNDPMVLLEGELELVVIWDNSVVDECNSLFVVEVRVGIHVSLVSVSGPPGVPDANKMVMLSFAFKLQPLDAVSSESVSGCEFVHLELSAFLIDRDNPTWIVSSWLKNVQAIDADITSLLLVSNISNDAAALILRLLPHHVVEAESCPHEHEMPASLVLSSSPKSVDRPEFGQLGYSWHINIFLTD